MQQRPLFQAIRDSADDLGLPKEYQGSGLPNVLKALNLSADSGSETPNPEDSGCNQNWQEIEMLLKQALNLLQDMAA